MAPKIPVEEVPESIKALRSAFDSVWAPEAKDPSTALQVLQDHFKEAVGSTSGPNAGSREFGLNSLEVKKDLYKKASTVTGDHWSERESPMRIGGAVLTPQEAQADRAVEASNQNQAKRNARQEAVFREARQNAPSEEEFDAVKWPNGTGSPIAEQRWSHSKGGTRKPPAFVGSSRAAASSAYPEDAKTRPSDSVWKNLMEDPAFPMLAKVLGGGAAVGAGLAASNAEASTKKKNIIDEKITKPKSALTVGGLGLIPAIVPKPPNWEGVTQHILDNERQVKQVEEAKANMGSPDVFTPEQQEAQAKQDTVDAINNHMKYSTPAGAAAEGLSALEKHFVDPYIVKPFQENIGKPIMDYAIDRLTKKGEKGPAGVFDEGQTKFGEAGGEYPLRAGSQLIAGKGQFDAYGETPKATKDVNAMEDKFGPVGAAAVASGAKIAGELPLFVVRGPAVLKAFGGTVEAAGTGAAMGLLDPEMSVGEGAFGGALLHTGSSMISKGATILGDLFKGVRESVTPLIEESARAPAPIFSPETSMKLGPLGEENRLGKVSDPSFKLGPLGEARRLQNAEGAKVLGKKVQNSPYEGRLVGVITRDGLDAITQQVTQAPHVVSQRKTPLALPAGTKPSMVVADLDHNGFPVLRKVYDDPSSISGERIEVEPLTLASAKWVNKNVRTFTISNELHQREPDYRGEIGALLGFGMKMDVVRSTPLSEFDLADTVISAGRDYEGTVVKPAGAEVRIINNKPQITPVFDGETRLPDEAPPFVSGPPTRAEGPNRVSDPGNWRTQIDYHNGSETLQIDPRRLERELGNEQTVTKRMNTLDQHIIQDKPYIGGGSGGQPPPKKLLGAGKDTSSALRIRGDMPIERPAEFPEPNEKTVSWDVIDMMGQVTENIRRINADKGMFDWALSKVVGRHLRGPIDQATLVQSIQASSLLQRSSDDIFKAARQTFTPKLLDQYDRDLQEFFTGRKDWEWVKGRNSGVTEKAQQYAQNLLDTTQAYDAYLQQNGVVPESLGQARLDGTMDLYLTRRYLAFAMPQGRWAKKILAPGMIDTFNDGVNFIYKEAVKRNPNVTVDQITDEVRRIIQTKDPLESFKASNISKPFFSLMERGNPPEPIRKLLGEIESGMSNIAITIGTQSAIASRLDLMKEVSLNPKWSSSTFNEAMDHLYQLPDHPSMFSARNRYVSQEIYEAIGNGPKIEGSSHAIVHNVLGFIKGNQVALGGLGPHINSVFGNLQSGVLAGGLDLTRPLKSGAALGKAFRAMRDYAADPTGQTGLGGIIVDARRTGADYFGFSHEEIGNPNARKWLRMMEDVFPDDKPVSLFHAWGRVMKNSMDRYRDFQSWAGGGLDWVDRLFRLQSYISLQEKFLADLGKRGDKSYLVKSGMLPAQGETRVTIHDPKTGKTIGLTSYMKAAEEVRVMQNALVKTNEINKEHRLVLEAAARLASRRVNQSFWNPTFIGSGLDSLRKSAVGVVTPYATAAFESFRVMAAIPARMAQEPDLKWRLLVTSGVVAGVAGIFRHYSAVSDEEIAAAYATMPKSKQTFKPGTFALAWHDDKGRPQIWDMTRVWDPLRFAVGHPDDAMCRRVLVNLFLAPVEGTSAGSAARDAFVSGGFVRSTDYQQPLSMSQAGGLKILQHLHKAGAFPNAFKGMIDAARRTEGSPVFRPRPTEEPLTLGQGALKFTGVTNDEPVTLGKGPSQFTSAIEMKKENKTLKTDAYRVRREGGDMQEIRDEAAALGAQRKEKNAAKRIFKK